MRKAALAWLGLAATTALIPLFVVVVVVSAVVEPAQGAAGGWSDLARADIPPEMLALYERAAATCPGLAPAVLAAIGKVETDHGRNVATSSAGAQGPMQFMPATWSAYGADGDGDGATDVNNSADAVFGSVRYLCANGAGDPTRLRDAIWAYNHADWYVDKVMDLAARYAGPSGPSVVISPTGGPLSLATVRGITVAAHVAPYLEQLLAAAEADRVVLSGSGWRSTQDQIALRSANGCPDVYTAPASSCQVPTAIPGTSMHEVGEAVDFIQGGSTLSRSSPGFSWLTANAARFGFYNLPSEAWHWSTNGR